MSAGSRRQASHLASTKIADHPEPVIEVSRHRACSTLAVGPCCATARIEPDELITTKDLGLGILLGGRQARGPRNGNEGSMTPRLDAVHRFPHCKTPQSQRNFTA